MTAKMEELEQARYEAWMGMAPRRIPHWEHWSCPDAETYLTGLDYYDHPKLCREKLRELYPELALPVPETDEPIPRPRLGGDGPSSDLKKRTVRWGDGESGTWEHGEMRFKSPEQVFAFSPLDNPDFSDNPGVVESADFSSEETIYERYRKNYPSEWGDLAPERTPTCVGFYNTMFMWPLLTFGWEMFLASCLDPRFERIMGEFAEINRRVFSAFARLPVNFVICHDDIVTTRGPVCSPSWMRKHVFGRYEEFWSILRASGKEVIFMSDGKMDAYADDVIACGARGIISEPYTDYRAIARRHLGKDLFLAGEGDNRTLSRNDPDEIDAMVKSMVETAAMTGGYMMCIGNHIPWNVSPQGIKRYLDRSREWAWR
jgi:hypothetical protein